MESLKSNLNFAADNIDKAHHSNKYKLALEEALRWEEALKTAIKMTNEEDTLILLTADHSHPLTLNGYTPRGTDILGL